jgi:hypothetical protein
VPISTLKMRYRDLAENDDALELFLAVSANVLNRLMAAFNAITSSNAPCNGAAACILDLDELRQAHSGNRPFAARPAAVGVCRLKRPLRCSRRRQRTALVRP